MFIIFNCYRCWSFVIVIFIFIKIDIYWSFSCDGRFFDVFVFGIFFYSGNFSSFFFLIGSFYCGIFFSFFKFIDKGLFCVNFGSDIGLKFGDCFFEMFLGSWKK